MTARMTVDRSKVADMTFAHVIAVVVAVAIVVAVAVAVVVVAVVVAVCVVAVVVISGAQQLCCSNSFLWKDVSLSPACCSLPLVVVIRPKTS